MLNDIYSGLTRFQGKDRMSLIEANAVLNDSFNFLNEVDKDKSTMLPNIKAVNLKLSQATAVEQISMFSSSEQAEAALMLKDASNACAFLAVKIADTIINSNPSDLTADLSRITEKTIAELPGKINAHRNRGSYYDAIEANNIMYKQSLLSSFYEFSEEILTPDSIFSVNGRKMLQGKLCKLAEEDFVAIYICSPFVLTIGCRLKQPFLIDTHPVTLAPGNGNGLVLVGLNSSGETWESLCNWLCQRLRHGGAKSTEQQSLAVMTSKEKYIANENKHEYDVFSANDSVQNSLGRQDDGKTPRFSVDEDFGSDPVIVAFTCNSKRKNEDSGRDGNVLSKRTYLPEVSPRFSVDEDFGSDPVIVAFTCNSKRKDTGGNEEVFPSDPENCLEDIGSQTSQLKGVLQYYNNDKIFPIFEHGKDKRYTVREAVEILQKTQGKEKCLRTPPRVRQNISFLVDLSKFKCWQDVKADMNGIYPRLLRAATWTVEVDDDTNVIEIVKKKNLLKRGKFHIYTHTSANKQGLCRSIFFLLGNAGEIVNNTCILQYSILIKGCEEVVFNVGSHGNRKTHGKPFYPLKKSILDDLRNELDNNSAAVAFKNISSASGGMVGANDPSELPRSRQQLYDMNAKRHKTDEIDELLLYAKHADEIVVLEHHDIPEDLWVLGKKHMTKDISKFCTSDKLSHPFSVDPTFNFGKYEVTPMTYKHLFLKSKRTGMPPSFLGPTAIHYSKGKNVFKKIVHAICNNTPGLAEQGKGFITDGEQALYTALSEEMPQATGLRCFRHFQQNCRDKLRQLGISNHKTQKKFIDIVFGGETGEGILGADDKHALKSRIDSSKQILEQEEMKMTNKRPDFFSYISTHRKMMQRHMIASVRSKAGMPLDTKGRPVRCYTNQSESINNKLTRMKEAATKSDKNKVDMTKLKFTREVFEEVDRHQQEEMMLAVCGLSEEFQLSDMVSYVQVDPEDWFQMNKNERGQYIEAFNDLTIEDSLKKKRIKFSEIPVLIHEFRRFSKDIVSNLSTCTTYLSEGLLGKIVTEAETLLNTPSAVSKRPTHLDQLKVYLVAAKNCKAGMYECKVYKDHVNCSCPCFKYKYICKHSLCIAEIAGILSDHIAFLSKSLNRTKPSKADLLKPPSPAHGKKGSSNKNPWRPERRPSTNTKSDVSEGRPYCEIYHNDHPFIVCFLKDVPDSQKNKACRACSIDFPRRQIIVPYDLVLSHQERWYYPDPNNKSESKPTYIRLTNRYYCVARSGIYNRFPYFTPAYLEILPEIKSMLQQSHIDHLKRELDYTSEM